MFLSSILVVVVAGFGCAPENGGTTSISRPPEAVANPVLRPSQNAVILARSLDFKTDTRISYCEVLGSENASYSGYRDQKLFPLASLSKLITTAWAVQKLGPDHKFKSIWHLKAVDGAPGVVDAYLRTNLDPIFNIEKVLYSLSLLRQNGVSRIRHLVIDETTRVYLSVLLQPHLELEQIPISSNDSVQNLTLILNSKNWAGQTEMARANLKKWATANNRKLDLPNQFSVERVEFKKSSEIDKSSYTNQIEVKSVSLLKYLKNLNVFSNNYVSDAIYSYLGGSSEFAKFQNAVLKLNSNQLQVFTGSGLADNSVGIRKDNLGSCFAIINVLKYLDQLGQQHQLNLGHVLYNPTLDKDGTFESSVTVSNNVVLKTGRLYQNPALNLAGIISTEKGSVYFSFLGHDFNEDEAAEIEAARDKLLNSALKYYPIKNTYSSLKDFQIFIN